MAFWFLGKVCWWDYDISNYLSLITRIVLLLSSLCLMYVFSSLRSPLPFVFFLFHSGYLLHILLLEGLHFSTHFSHHGCGVLLVVIYFIRYLLVIVCHVSTGYHLDSVECPFDPMVDVKNVFTKLEYDYLSPIWSLIS